MLVNLPFKFVNINSSGDFKNEADKKKFQGKQLNKTLGDPEKNIMKYEKKLKLSLFALIFAWKLQLLRQC